MSWMHAFRLAILWIVIGALVIAALVAMVVGLAVLSPAARAIIIFILLWCVTAVAIKTAP